VNATEFKVMAVSSNANAFGLHGVVLIAVDGEAWEVACSMYHLPIVGDILRPPVVRGVLYWGLLGFEIPEKLEPNAPHDVLKQVWGEDYKEKARQQAELNTVHNVPEGELAIQ
jgi:hypothetical protein